MYAFGLLEALARVGMPFIFKGGTCLMLLMDNPRRLSTDIDIVVEPGTDLDDYLEKASVIFPFQKVEEQKRVGKDDIEKRHLKFTYDSPINNKQFYILLDVLFEANYYTEVKCVLTLQKECVRSERKLLFRSISENALTISMKIWVVTYLLKHLQR